MEGNSIYNALLTDVRLGDGVDGWEVARRIRQKEPSLPVIYVTGSTAEEWASQGVPSSILVSKPFARAAARCARESPQHCLTADDIGQKKTALAVGLTKTVRSEEPPEPSS